MLKIRVVIADDDAALVGALADTISGTDDLQLVGVAGDTNSVVNATVANRPDVVLMDVRMPGGGGVVATRAVLARLPSVKVVGLSAHEDHTTAQQMIEARAMGYIVKGMPENEILDAIRRASRGQLSMPADLAVECFRDLLSKLREHIESESAWRFSEERVYTLFDAMPTAMLIVNPSDDIEYANTPALLLFGYSAGELIGKGVEVLVRGQSRQVHKDLVAIFKAHPRTQRQGAAVLLYGRRKDGSKFPVDVGLSPMATAHGVTVVAVIRDMSLSREADEVRRKSERMFKGLLESAPDAIVVVDIKGRIQVVNCRTEQLFGYSRQDLLGLSIDALVPDSLRSGHAAYLDKYLKDPQGGAARRGLELLGRRRDGSEFPVDISLSPMPSAEGLLIIAAVRDVTDRKVAAQRLAQSQETAERQRLMAHMLKVQDEERRKIAADIHDDSIQVMTAASLRIQQLRKQLTDYRQKESLNKLDGAVRESITRLRRLMFDLRPPALDRAGLAAALRELLDQMTVETAVEYVVVDRLPREPAGDVRIELYRIAQEALANVRKHAQAKKVRVELYWIEPGYQVRITDDGAGFDLATGSGRVGHLGLIAMRERAQIAGGTWKIESSAGTGTTVEFWLPDPRNEGSKAPATGH